MRIFLLPVSTRRTLIYCERLQPSPSTSTQVPISERILNRAAQTWAEWERADKGWRKQLVVQGNKLLSRIAFEEWGLKSLPPLTKSRLEDLRSGKLKFECLYPPRFLSSSHQDPSASSAANTSGSGKNADEIAHSILARLALERQALHRRRMWTSIAWIPVSIPFTLVPVIPNIPFFYLCFRAYSHYRALYGGRLLAHLTSTPGLLAIRPSKEMEEVYARGLSGKSEKSAEGICILSGEKLEAIAAEALSHAAGKGEKGETLLLQQSSGRLLAEQFGVPELQMEAERAVTQVEAAIAKLEGGPTESSNADKEAKNLKTH